MTDEHRDQLRDEANPHEDDEEMTIILEDEAGSFSDSVTQTVPVFEESEDTEEVFVLLPDGDAADIPLAATEEVELTQPLEGSPHLQTAFDAATAPSAGAGLRRDNPAEFGETSPMQTEHLEFTVDEPTEACFVAEEPTDPVGPGDLESLATQVADEFIADDSFIAEDGEYDDTEVHQTFEPADEDGFAATPSRSRRKRGSFAKRFALVAAALVVGVGSAVYFVPEYCGPLPGYVDSVAAMLGFASEDDAGGTAIVGPAVPPPVDDPTVAVDPVDPDENPAEVALATFRNRVRDSIEWGFRSSDSP